MTALPSAVRADLDIVMADDREPQSDAYVRLMAATEEPVDWAYAVWDELVAGLASRSNRIRAIAGQVLCNLAKSDPEARMRRDFARLLDATHDEKFVTARHILLSLWKIGLVSPPMRTFLLERLAERFHVAAAEKNGTLVRYDLLVGLKSLFEVTADASIPPLAHSLIEAEKDEKYARKYRTVWKAQKPA